MPTVLVQGRIAAPHADRLKRHAPEGWDVTVWDPASDPVEAFEPLALEADVIVGGGVPIAWPDVPNLKLFQIPWTGFDFTAPAKMPPGVPVANTYEHETTIAEFIMASILEMRVGLRTLDADFRAGGWQGLAPGVSPIHREVRGTTLGVIGYGHIGHETAVRANAFGMRCIGVRRSQQPRPAELEWLGQNDRMDELLRTSDFVLVACDMNDETIGMIDADALAKMKPDAVIINVARGKIIEEGALFDALSNRRIGGAVLDVWYNYQMPDAPPVWPSNRPFQDLDNVILSAHRSASTEEMHERRWKFVADNCARIGRGETPTNVVFTGTGAASSDVGGAGGIG